MAIFLGSDSGIKKESSLSSVWSELTSGLTQTFSAIADNFTRLTGSPSGIENSLKPENVYIDDGFSNVPGADFNGSRLSGIKDIKKRRVVSQEPQATVIVKKKMFSSFRSNFDSKFMSAGEKLFVRASKFLFEKKSKYRILRK